MSERYCDRCRAQVPIEEFKLDAATMIVRHEGEQRGVTDWCDTTDRRCMGVLGKVSERIDE